MSSWRNAPISVSESPPASTVAMRPARLSRPLSILKAELPVITTFTETLSTRDLSCACQPSIFCTSSRKRYAFWPSLARELNLSLDIFCSNQSEILRMGSSILRSGDNSSNCVRNMFLGNTPSASKSSMIWNCAVVFPTWRGPRTATIGAISASIRRRICVTRWRRIPGGCGISRPVHQGFMRCKSAYSCAGISVAGK